MQETATSWFKIALCLCGLYWSSTVTAAEGAAGRGYGVANVEVMIDRIQREPSGQARAGLAKELFGIVKRSDVAGFDPAVMDSIAKLLRDDDDWVRVWAAESLGHIGPPASRTVPALKKALHEALSKPGYLGYFGPDFNSASPILGALELITGTPWIKILEAETGKKIWE